MVPSRLLRDIATQQAEEDELAWFAELLIDALQIPEVVGALNKAIAARGTPTPPVPRPAARITARSRSRGGRRG